MTDPMAKDSASENPQNLNELPDLLLIILAKAQFERVESLLKGHEAGDGKYLIRNGSIEEREVLRLNEITRELENRGLIPRSEPEPPVPQRNASIVPPKRRISFKCLTPIVLLIFAWLIVFNMPPPQPPPGPPPEPPPRFLARTGAASFAEMMAEPPSFIYGSSIHLWVYQGSDEVPTEVAVTGHADSSTCKRVSGLFFNALLQKAEDQEDIFVAGAGRLLRHEDPTLRSQLETRPAIKAYRKLQSERALAELALTYSEGIPVQSGSQASSITTLKARIRDIDERIESQKKNPDVVAYLRESTSGEALKALVRETARVSDTSGLVNVHRLPADIPLKARERVKQAAVAGKSAVVSFEDLLASAGAGDAVVLMNVLQIGTGVPISMRIPAKSLSSDAFEEAKRNNRQGVENAMIGDAEERRRFYDKKISEQESQLADCKRMSAEERAKVVSLEQTCTADGVCFKSKHATQMTNDDYCTRQIPSNMKLVRQWDDEAKSLLKDLSADQERPGGSRIEQLNHSTVVDSLLRDWALPLSKGQGAFDTWRAQLRGPIWETLRRKLAYVHIDENSLTGENVVFSVVTEGPDIIVRPVHVVDLARSVVVVDPKAGAVRLVDAWAQRTLIRSNADEEAHTMKQRAEERVNAAVERALQGDAVSADTVLKEGFSADPTAAVRQIEGHFLKYWRDDTAQVAQMISKLRPTLATTNILTALHDLRDNPKLKDDPFEYLRGLHTLIASNPDVPVDRHLELAMGTAELIAAVESYLLDAGPTNSWDIMEAVASGDARLTVERRALTLIEEKVGIDPTRAIRNAIAVVEKRAPAYLNAAREARGLPLEPSDELKKALSGMDALSLFELEALELEQIRALLTASSAASRAAANLATAGTIDLAQVTQDLAKATPAGETAPIPVLISVRDRVKQYVEIGYHPDTLARMEAASDASRGSEQLVSLANHISTTDHIGLRDHARLGARVRYESSDYGAALDALYGEGVALSLYHPALKWEILKNDWIGVARKIHARQTDRGIVIAANADDTSARRDVLLLLGIDGDDARGLIRRINAARWQPFDHGRVSDQILMLKVPLHDKPHFLQAFITKNARLAVIKAMVYGCAPPAGDIVPDSARCSTLSGTDRYDRVEGGQVIAVETPTLDAVKNSARVPDVSHATPHP